MQIRIFNAVLATLLFVVGHQEAHAQAGPQNPPLKEVRVEASAFSLGDPMPSWVDVAEVPDVTSPAPLVLRLADTQLLVAEAPVAFARRSFTVNDPSSLTSAGQIPIAFDPHYQRLQLHAIVLTRGGERRIVRSPHQFVFFSANWASSAASIADRSRRRS